MLTIVLKTTVASVTAVVLRVRKWCLYVSNFLFDHLILSSLSVLFLEYRELRSVLLMQLLAHKDETDFRQTGNAPELSVIQGQAFLLARVFYWVENVEEQPAA